MRVRRLAKVGLDRFVMQNLEAFPGENFLRHFTQDLAIRTCGTVIPKVYFYFYDYFYDYGPDWRPFCSTAVLPASLDWPSSGQFECSIGSHLLLVASPFYNPGQRENAGLCGHSTVGSLDTRAIRRRRPSSGCNLSARSNLHAETGILDN